MSVHAFALALVPLVFAPSLTPKEQINVGEAYTQRGEPQKAINLLQKALKAKSISPQQRARAEGALGLAYLQLKKPKPAVEHLEKAIELDKSREDNWMLLGMAHDIRGQYADAVKVYRRATQALPKSPELHHELGMSLLEAGEVKAALQGLKKAAKLAPQNPDFLADLAYGQLRAGKPKDARASAKLAIARAPDSAAAFYTLADAEAALGQTKAARSGYQKALELDPTFSPALFQFALLEAEAKRPVAACKKLLRLLRIEPEHARGRRLLLRESSRLPPEKATKVLAAAVKVLPKFADLWALRAETAAKAGDAAAAVKHMQMAAKLAPRDKRFSTRLKELRAAKANSPKAP